MAIEVQLVRGTFSSPFVDDLQRLSERVFGRTAREYLQWRIEHMPDVTVFVVSQDGFMIGFKAGYAMTADRYYSWLGGVDPGARRSGVASQLMGAQHQWLEGSPYCLVETHVRQENAPMIALNLKHGFRITGMFMKTKEPNYIMQREVEKHSDE